MNCFFYATDKLLNPGQNGPTAKSAVLPATTLFFWKFCFSLKTLYKELTWWTNHPNLHIHNFWKCWTLILGCFFLVSILKSSFFMAMIHQTTIHIWYFFEIPFLSFHNIKLKNTNLALGRELSLNKFLYCFYVLILSVMSFMPVCAMIQSGFWPTNISISASTVSLVPPGMFLTFASWFL